MVVRDRSVVRPRVAHAWSHRGLFDVEGRYICETIVPSPIAALVPGGRIALEKTEGYEVEQDQLKRRQTLAWWWQYDPVFRLVYRYA